MAAESPGDRTTRLQRVLTAWRIAAGDGEIQPAADDSAIERAVTALAVRCRATS